MEVALGQAVEPRSNSGIEDVHQFLGNMVLTREKALSKYDGRFGSIGEK